MHVAWIVRSGTTVSVELPAGFAISDHEMEVEQQGASILLRPITASPAGDEWAWLDKFEAPISDDLAEAFDVFDCTFREMDQADRGMMGQPPSLD